jgi:hypothetical protein
MSRTAVTSWVAAIADAPKEKGLALGQEFFFRKKQ